MECGMERRFHRGFTAAELEMKKASMRRACATRKKLPLATMSRHLLALDHVNLGLVKTRAGVGGSRYVRRDLTEKGLSLAKRMAGAIAPKVRETMR